MTSQSLIVTGVIKRTVVTLSRKDERTAVNKQRQLINGHTSPFVICNGKNSAIIELIPLLF